MTSKSPTSNLLENEANSPSTILVIFGASGDLTARKLAPAIFNLSLDGLLPSECFLIGYGRQRMSDDEFKAYLKDSLDAHSRRRIGGKAWEQLEGKISFQAGSYDDPKSFEELKLKIEGIEKHWANRCSAFSTFPRLRGFSSQSWKTWVREDWQNAIRKSNSSRRSLSKSLLGGTWKAPVS